MNTTLSVCPHCSQLNRLPEDRLRAPARCGSCKEPLFSAVPIALDDSRFRRIVERGDVPVLVDFWAPGAPPAVSSARYLKAQRATICTDWCSSKLIPKEPR